MNDWFNENENRAYPFVYNQNATGLETNEIVDAQFYILSDQIASPNVYLVSNDNEEYVFACTGLPDIKFKTHGVPGYSTIWATPDNEEFQSLDTDPTWYGMITIGPREPVE